MIIDVGNLMLMEYLCLPAPSFEFAPVAPSAWTRNKTPHDESSRCGSEFLHFKSSDAGGMIVLQLNKTDDRSGVCLAYENLTMHDEKLDMRLYEEEGFVQQNRRDQWVCSRVLTKLNDCWMFNWEGHIEGGISKDRPSSRAQDYGSWRRWDRNEDLGKDSTLVYNKNTRAVQEPSRRLQGVTFGDARGGRSVR